VGREVSAPLSAEDLERIRQRTEQARMTAPVDWWPEPYPDRYPGSWAVLESSEDSEFQPLIIVDQDDVPGSAEARARFIEHAGTDVLTLLAEIERLRAEVAQVVHDRHLLRHRIAELEAPEPVLVTKVDRLQQHLTKAHQAVDYKTPCAGCS
jgi:hypothetical protein